MPKFPKIHPFWCPHLSLTDNLKARDASASKNTFSPTLEIKTRKLPPPDLNHQLCHCHKLYQNCCTTVIKAPQPPFCNAEACHHHLAVTLPSFCYKATRHLAIHGNHSQDCCFILYKILAQQQLSRKLSLKMSPFLALFLCSWLSQSRKHF